MKRLLLCGIVALSILGLMVGTVYGWHGGWRRGGWGWGRGYWGGPRFGFGINIGPRPVVVANPYVADPYYSGYRRGRPSRRYCEKYPNDDDCVRYYGRQK